MKNNFSILRLFLIITIIGYSSYGFTQTLHKQFSINQPPVLSVIVEAGILECYGQNTGTINLTTDGGTTPYAYSWEGYAGTGNYREELTAGVYYFTVTDQSGCTVTDEAIIVEVDEIIGYAYEELLEGDSIFAGGAWQYMEGTYYDTLTAVNGCDSIVITEVTIMWHECYAGFYAEVISDNDVVFFNYSEGGTSYFWDFGNGEFMNSMDEELFYTFPASGFFNVCLTIIDSLGLCHDQICQVIEVEVGVEDCYAAFSFNTVSGNTSSFDGSASLGQITNYFWNFGDGNLSAAINPTHTFAVGGYYNVTLSIRDSVNNCSSSITELITVGDPSNDCEARFTYHSDLQNNKVSFFNGSYGNNLDTYLWNLGDGNFAYTSNFEHTYDEPAYYNVCLSVLSTSTGCANITCKTIKVGDNERSCNASFTYLVDSTYNKSVGRQVGFKGAAFGDPAKSTWNILWNFGDGNYDSTTLSPVHIYADTGMYKVTLKISSAYCSDTYFAMVNAGSQINQLFGGFIYNIDTTGNKSNQYPADFKGSSFGDPAVIAWDFGDGGMDSTTLTPTHIYDAPGSYQVCFTVSDPNLGQSHTNCDSLFIDEIVKAISLSTAQIAVEIYPNPATERSFIAYHLPEATHLHISVNDIYGRSVQVLKSSNEPSGSNTILWDVSSLPSGIYLVSLQTKESKLTKRVIVK